VTLASAGKRHQAPGTSDATVVVAAPPAKRNRFRARDGQQAGQSARSASFAPGQDPAAAQRGGNKRRTGGTGSGSGGGGTGGDGNGRTKKQMR
ncbi:unnamed protein product, partial [Laminaria digitata]